MRLLSVIGTRPQYIKIKPFFDRCLKEKIYHEILDTWQHFSPNVSEELVQDLRLKIDYRLDTSNLDELTFISNGILELKKLILKIKPDLILVYGDTNSTLMAALVAYKLCIPVVHVEAGMRSQDSKLPEEINRIATDAIASINFCSTTAVLNNAENSVFVGDLEYEYLNKINPAIKKIDYGVMTIHRQNNSSKEALQTILDFSGTISRDIFFFAHHRMKPYLKKIKKPDNVTIRDSINYTEMIHELASCKFVITDSGSIQKLSPFFGKRTLVMRKNTEWIETERSGYARKCSFSDADKRWLFGNAPARNTKFYLDSEMPSQIILETIRNFLGK